MNSNSFYVPLWCKSNGSFLEGASHPHELVDTAHALGLPALAITDRDGLYGVVRAYVRAKELGIKLIVGAQVTVEDSFLLLLAQNRLGYANLCSLLTTGRLRSPKGMCRVGWKEVYAHADGLLALWGGSGSFLAGEAEPVMVAHGLHQAFGDRLYAMIARHRHDLEVPGEKRLCERARKFRIPLVATIEVLYHTPARRDLQDILTCIRHGVTLHTAGRLTKPNANHAIVNPNTFSDLFWDHKDAIERTLEIAERCTFSFAELRYRYPAEKIPETSSPEQWLRYLTYNGANERYNNQVSPQVKSQLDQELNLISELEYGGYFLTMYEIVQFCRSQGILCQGRGSAANSAVCYCLGITSVDPVRMELLFERFLSKERAEPPDIDLDISHARREEVIRHVYDKYGRDRAAMVANVIRYRSRSALRDVGKALGLQMTALDQLSKLHSWSDETTEDMLRFAGLDPAADAVRHMLRLANEILDFPRHLSIHPGGFLLGHEPVHTLVPIENATMEGRTVIQWDKDDVEALGLFKVDLLGLGALTHLDLCFRLLNNYRNKNVSMATIPPADPETFAMISAGDTVGVFQIESRAQMAMLPRLRPQSYYDIVIQVSIVRPGPISGGMVHPYLRRRQGLEEVTYPHPCLEPVLRRTLGVPLFQEQVMRLAIVAADYTPGEADQLRRDMAAWRRSGQIDKHRERLVSRMQQKGIPEEFAVRVFEQIRGFGEYGFPESHAASFALIAYATAWLRCHYPAEFLCALLNALPMGFYSAATLVADAQRKGIEIRPIAVGPSEWDCTLEPATSPTENRPFAVRIGLRFVNGLGKGERTKIEAGAAQGAFSGLSDFVQRTRLGLRPLEALAKAGAFEIMGLSRREALWSVRKTIKDSANSLPITAHEQQAHFSQLDLFQTIAWDYQASSHSPRGHPMEPLRADLQRLGLPDSNKLATMPHGTRTQYIGVVICRQRPMTAAGVTFMTLEDEMGFVNIVVWNTVFERYKLIAKTATLLGVSGRLQQQDNVVHLIADSLWIPDLLAPANPESRDFH